MQFLLRGGHAIQLDAHVLNLLGLRVVNVGLPRDIAVALFDLGLRSLVLLSHVALGLLRLGKLDLHVAQRVLQLLVLDFAQAQHLAILNFCTLLALHSEAATHYSILL